MANWTCVTLFGSGSRRLDVASAVRVLEAEEFVIDGHVHCWKDSRSADARATRNPKAGTTVAERLSSLAANAISFELEFTQDGILGSLGYDHGDDPSLSIGAHGRMLARLDDYRQQTYWGAVKRAAQAAGAAYGLVTVDVADGMEERFVEIDGVRLIDVEDECWRDFLIEVWVFPQNGGVPIHATGDRQPEFDVCWLTA